MNKPTKPNITIPESFAANGVKADFDNNKILNGFDRIQPDVLAGDNLNKFIDDTYKGLNYALDIGDYIEEGIANTDLSNLSETGNAKFVKKSGDTMTGNLHLYNQSTTSVLGLKHSHVVSQTPSATINYGYLGAFDGDNTHLGGVAVMQNTSGVVSAYLRTTYGSTKQITISSDGSTSCPTPASGDNSTKIATTAYCVARRCTTKPTTTSSASVTRPCWVVQNYLNGTSWYRVWSDGFIEQGGRVSLTGQKDHTVTFLKAFSTANATVITQHYGEGVSNTYTNAFAVKSITASDFKLWPAFTESGRSALWYACGY